MFVRTSTSQTGFLSANAEEQYQADHRYCEIVVAWWVLHSYQWLNTNSPREFISGAQRVIFQGQFNVGGSRQSLPQASLVSISGPGIRDQAANVEFLMTLGLFPPPPVVRNSFAFARFFLATFSTVEQMEACDRIRFDLHLAQRKKHCPRVRSAANVGAENRCCVLRVESWTARAPTGNPSKLVLCVSRLRDRNPAESRCGFVVKSSVKSCDRRDLFGFVHRGTAFDKSADVQIVSHRPVWKS